MPSITKTSVVFQHVAKTAGSTFENILNRQYDPNRIYRLTADTPDELLRAIHRYKRMSLAERASYDLVAGHSAFSVFDDIPGQRVGITFLRDPVERVISHYFYAKRRPDHPLYSMAMDLDLGDYTLSLPNELQNRCTQVFASLTHREINADPEAALAVAKKNLKVHFRVIGLTERFDESIVLIAHRLGWNQFPYYQRLNVTSKRPKRSQVSDQALRVIREANALDIRLYESASEWFQEAIDEGGSLLSKKIRHFVNMNSYYQLYLKMQRQRRLILSHPQVLVPMLKSRLKQGYVNRKRSRGVSQG